MANLYVFAIGGTGSRVLRSLTMLLAAGVKCEHNIVPIIIDPDDSAADLTRASELMKKYASIRNKLSFTDNVENRFFQTEIKQIVPNFRLPLSNTRDIEFKDYMGFDSMSEANRAFLSVLFSNDNMTADMKVGFKGNPNIGSVVLNQISDSKEFIEFANNLSTQENPVVLKLNIESIDDTTTIEQNIKLIENYKNSVEIKDTTLKLYKIIDISN